MNPDNAFSVVAQSIIDLLTTHSDLFLNLGIHLFRGFAVMLIAWFGVKAALSAAEGGPGLPISRFASLLMTIAFGWIATAIAVLVGPIFIPFFIVPQLDWLFWGWLKAFLQYAFYRVIAQAFVFVFGNLLLHFTRAVPPPYTMEMIVFTYAQLVLVLLAFIYGMLKVPSLVNSLFTGRSGETSLPAFLS